MFFSIGQGDCRRRNSRIPWRIAAECGCGVCLLFLVLAPLCAQQAASPAADEHATVEPSAVSSAPAPSPEQLRLLLERVIASTHRGDAAEADYARTEHWVERRHAGDKDPVLDRVYRVYPTGTGTMKAMVEDSGVRVTPEKYRDELHELEQDLEWALQPNEPSQHARVEKWQKRTAQRYRAVENFRDSYIVTWLGAERLPAYSGTEPLAKLRLEPKPGAASGSIATELLAASRITLWAVPKTGGVVQLDAELVRDLNFGGGLLGKIDKGGHVHIEQTEVTPGIWLPCVITNDVRGRKFLVHEESMRTIETRDHRRVGGPAELLEQVRRVLSNPDSQVPAP